MNDHELEARNELVFRYPILRAVIGIMGFALPLVVWIGGWLVFRYPIQDSISSYYHTYMRDVFVGVTWAMGFFLLAYQGYTKEDRWYSNLACLFAVLLAIFPTAPEKPYSDLVQWISYIHLACAAGFFIFLTLIAVRQFRKFDPDLGTTLHKDRRNRVYLWCGIVMIASLALIVVTSLVPAIKDALAGAKPLFWLETTAIWAFAVSWMTKGGILKFLNDREGEKSVKS